MRIKISMCTNNTSEKIMNKKKSSMMRFIKKSLNNGYNTFIQILTITYHHLQWTQVLWMSTTMTHKNLLTTHNIFTIIADESYVNTRETTYKQVPKILANAQIYVGPNSHAFTDIAIFTYIRSVNFNVKFLMASNILQEVLDFPS